MKRILIAALILAAALSGLAAETSLKSYRPSFVKDRAPAVDGNASDPAWSDAAWEGGFLQSFPKEGESPTERTEFKILCDEANLYVLIRAFDREPDRVQRRVSRRDDSDSDYVSVLIDSFHDHRTAFLFRLTAAGVRADAMYSGDAQTADAANFNWDPVWEGAAQVDAEGWTAEMRIPLSQLRYDGGDAMTWGIEVERRVHRTQELSCWVLVPAESKAFTSRFGHLEGLTGIKPTRRFEILPYSLGRLNLAPRQEGNPFAPGRTQKLAGGLDGKVGVGGDFTLDFTLNPDFGQVEADPSVLNLSAFEIMFPERRPFFVEGGNILNFRISRYGSFGQDNIFYSRRIGRAPQYSPPAAPGGFVQTPDSTSILGAFKLTGKTRNGLSLAVLETVTSNEQARMYSAGEMWDTPAEPMTNFFAARVQKDWDGGNTILGAMATAVNRMFNGVNPGLLGRAAYTGGLDFQKFWKDKSYYFFLNAVFSRIEGSPESLSRLQTSPVHYFQRPDAGYLDYDPTRTSLLGHGGNIEFGKQGGGHFRFKTSLSWRSPGLDLNDIGYLRASNIIKGWLSVSYENWKPFFVFRRITAELTQFRNWNFNGTQTDWGVYGLVNAILKNNWSLQATCERDAYELIVSELRGGPAFLFPGKWMGSLFLNSVRGRRFQFSAGIGLTKGDEQYRRSVSWMATLFFRPSKALEFSVGPSYTPQQTDFIYIRTLATPLGLRYLGASLNQKTLSLTARMNLYLTPDLSIQFYGQPFIATGAYSEFKRVTSPRAAEYSSRFHIIGPDELLPSGTGFGVDEDKDGIADYGLPQPDFRVLRFNSNLVLRWEFRPGSSVFLVWSQNRNGASPDPEFGLGGVRDLFSVVSTNVFLLKFSYWFSL